MTTVTTALRTALNRNIQDRHSRACSRINKLGTVHNGDRRWQWHVSLEQIKQTPTITFFLPPTDREQPAIRAQRLYTSTSFSQSSITKVRSITGTIRALHVPKTRCAIPSHPVSPPLPLTTVITPTYFTYKVTPATLASILGASEPRFMANVDWTINRIFRRRMYLQGRARPCANARRLLQKQKQRRSRRGAWAWR